VLDLRILRRWLYTAGPALLLTAAPLMATLWPGSESWPQRLPWFQSLPVLLFAAAAVLGLVFRQGRGTCVALLMLVFALRGRPAPDRTLVLAAGMLVLTPATAAFFIARERGLFSPYGVVRLSATAACAFALWMLPGTGFFADRLSRPSILNSPAWCENVPGMGMGLAILAITAAVLFLARRRENPFFGPMLFAALVIGLAGMAAGACRFVGPKADTAMHAAFSAAAAGLCWAMLDAAWRHAHVDELTGLPGRRPFRQHLGDLVGDYTLAVVDIDFFKKINDRHGHHVGDQALRFLASTLRECEGATAYRYGGEEFVLVFPRGSYERHLRALEALRAGIEKKSFALRSTVRPLKKPRAGGARKNAAARTISLTVSIGAARSGERRPTPDDVFMAADEALYRAKRTGRNRVCRTAA